MSDALSWARDQEEERLQKEYSTEYKTNVKLSSIIIFSTEISRIGEKIRELTEERDDLIQELKKLIGE